MSTNNSVIIVFDTETTGFSPIKHEIVQLSYIVYDIKSFNIVFSTQPGEDIVNINAPDIPAETSKVHGITKSMTTDKLSIKDHIDKFIYYCNMANMFVGHNIKFDIKMIVGQINKIINKDPSTASFYNDFLQRFQLDDSTFCTMNKSKTLCKETLGKPKKLIDLHKLLFNQDVGGTLHNALVDISVTLRIYLKLTQNIDICINSNSDNLTICNLINPMPVTTPVNNNNNATETLITGIQFVPDGYIENNIVVHSFANKFVNNVVNQAINKTLMFNECNVSVCKTIIKNGIRSGQVCERPLPCRYHSNKTIKNNKVQPLQPHAVATPQHKVASSFIKTLFNNITKKNKVVPIGGKRVKKNNSNKLINK